MALAVHPVASRADRRAFLRLPWSIYPGRWDAWVPPLLAQEKRRIDPRRNPFFEHGSVELFLARDGARPVGRIAAVENRLHDQVHGERTGFFGLFESVDDERVAAALFDAAAGWVRARGLERLRGPASFSTNEECGLLVDAFDEPPALLMNYNPPYYERLLVGCGFVKAMDLLAYRGTDGPELQRRLERVDRLLARRTADVVVRPLDLARFEDELRTIRGVYNRAWERNWGFVPMTDAEIAAMASDLRPIIEPELALIVERGGEALGFGLAVPDLNQVLRHLNGRLFPFGFLKVLRRRRWVHRVRVLALGIVPEQRGAGLDALVLREFFHRGARIGYHEAECSWMLETNAPMLRAIENIGFERSKTYRMFERPLSD